MNSPGYLRRANAEYIEALLEQYRLDPESVDASWRYFFDGMGLGDGSIPGSGPALKPTPSPTPSLSGPTAQVISIDLSAEAKVADLINAYREHGYLLAHLDPLGLKPERHPMLELSAFGLSSKDLDRTFTAGRLVGLGPSKLGDIIQMLQQTYSTSIGVEYTHIQSVNDRSWLTEKMERSRNREEVTDATRTLILRRLAQSQAFEQFLHTRYVAQKRFSLEGGETLIPTLDRVIGVAANLGVESVVLGMAHRGRLNVLAHVFGKDPEKIMLEFEDNTAQTGSMGAGDVKYHKGYSADIKTEAGREIHLSLAFNPSHLEFVDPIVEGLARGKQELSNDPTGKKVLPLLIHGDAAFAGQGVVYETLNLSQLRGYRTGGTIHIVLNNQVGFTTDPSDARSTRFSTDLAKMLEVPIFHVNGDDPEALWYVARLATEYRQEFKKDVFIDLVCYRKYGHNEGDEPAFTQPVQTAKIKKHPSPPEVYAGRVTTSGMDGSSILKGALAEFTESLSAAQTRARAEGPTPIQNAYKKQWSSYRAASAAEMLQPLETGVSAETLRALALKLRQVPPGFHVHPKLERFLAARGDAIQSGQGIDWGNGEALAYASLLAEGKTIRLSGQDVERGTFSHRHAVLHDIEDGKTWVPHQNLSPTQGRFHAFNSHLSETGTLGFEYGWSMAFPQSLTIWEAQFGDFCNSAQVIIDQFIAASEWKWNRASGLALFLPHGYEGQGPEHSHARMERFLQLCGNDNMVVANPTTPSQLFHLLRRQVHWTFRKPLIVFTPKSLLRHPLAVSNLTEFEKGSFREVLADPHVTQPRRIVLCSGKIYYDLLSERETRGIKDIAIVRIEQLYPWAAKTVGELLCASPSAELAFAQEEPRNMGPWPYVHGLWSGGLSDFQSVVGGRALRYIGRDISATPAVGSYKVHGKEQKLILDQALA